MRLAILIPFALAVPVFAFTAAAATWVVDDDGGAGVDFIDLPPAISAAAPGDRILVRGGIYSDFIIDKALKLVYDKWHFPATPIPWIGGMTSEIRDLAAADEVILSGLRIKGLHIHDCQGTVMLDDCGLGGVDSTAFPEPVLHIQNCDLIRITRCSITGLDPDISFGVDGAVQVENAKVVFSECEKIWGGDGGDASGAPAISAEDSDLLFFSSTAIGGLGGVYVDPDTGELYGGNGAPAFHLTDSNLELFGRSDDRIVGGSGFVCYPYPGGNAPAIVHKFSGKLVYSGITFKTTGGKPYISVLGGATAEEVSPAVPVILLEGTGEIGTTIQPVLYGQGDSTYFLYCSRTPSYLYIGYLYTQFLLDLGSLLLIDIGTIPSEGSVSMADLTIKSNPRLLGKELYYQAYVKTVGGQEYLSTSAGFVVQ